MQIASNIFTHIKCTEIVEHMQYEIYISNLQSLSILPRQTMTSTRFFIKPTVSA